MIAPDPDDAADGYELPDEVINQYVDILGGLNIGVLPPAVPFPWFGGDDAPRT